MCERESPHGREQASATAVVHVTPSVARESSGPTYTVVRLCESMIAAGAHAELATPDVDPNRPPPAFLRPFPPGRGPRRLGSSPALRRWLHARTRPGLGDDRGGRPGPGPAPILHAHGLWRMSVVYPAWAALRNGATLIVSPRGSLSPWAMRHHSAPKLLFWAALQRPALKRAACFHATSEQEVEDVRRLGFRQPIALVPNGIDLPALDGAAGDGAPKSRDGAPKSSDGTPKSAAGAPESRDGAPKSPAGTPKSRGEDRTLLFLARLHPVKGADALIDAWRMVQDRFPAWRLVIAGNDIDGRGSSGYADVLRSRAAERGAERVRFAGELRGDAKWEAYRDADLYVLPSHSESFGVTVAEALAARTPVIATRATPWRALAARGAGWCIETGPEPLAETLRYALARDSAELHEMGQRGRRWMAADYAWPEIGRRMVATCEWLRGVRAEKPEWVRTG